MEVEKCGDKLMSVLGQGQWERWENVVKVEMSVVG